MEYCVFCKIINKQIPAHVVYEDEKVIAILDRQPVRKGHVIVIPKQHIDHFIDLDDETAAHVIKVGNMLGKRIMQRLKPKRVGFAVAGFGVPHAHYHVIPMHEIHDITSLRYLSPEFADKALFSLDNVPVADDKSQEELADLLSC